MGFRSVAIEYDRPARFTGQTHYSLWKLMLLSLDAFFGFSISPLRLASVAGIAVTTLSFAVALVLAVRALAGSAPTAASLTACGLFFLGGAQMTCLGILGEYIGRIYRQSQARPIYLISKTVGQSNDRASAPVRAAA
jgi:hypothetical protein